MRIKPRLEFDIVLLVLHGVTGYRENMDLCEGKRARCFRGYGHARCLMSVPW